MIVNLFDIRDDAQVVRIQGNDIFLCNKQVNEKANRLTYRWFKFDITNGCLSEIPDQDWRLLGREPEYVTRMGEVHFVPDNAFSLIRTLILDKVDGSEVVQGIIKRGLSEKVKIVHNYLGGYQIEGGLTLADIIEKLEHQWNLDFADSIWDPVSYTHLTLPTT